MPASTHCRRSPSPYTHQQRNIATSKHAHVQAPPSPSLSTFTFSSTPSTTSGSTFSSPTSSSIFNASKCATSPPPTSFSAPELWTLYDFEVHARHCPTCRSVYHYRTPTNSTCHSGYDLAQKVVDVVYAKPGTEKRLEDGVARVRLPAGHVLVGGLLRCVEEEVRRRRRQVKRETEQREEKSTEESVDERKDSGVFEDTTRAETIRHSDEPRPNINDVSTKQAVVEIHYSENEMSLEDEARQYILQSPQTLLPKSSEYHSTAHQISRYDEYRPPTRGKPAVEISTPASTLRIRTAQPVEAAIVDGHGHRRVVSAPETTSTVLFPSPSTVTWAKESLLNPARPERATGQRVSSDSKRASSSSSGKTASVGSSSTNNGSKKEKSSVQSQNQQRRRGRSKSPAELRRDMGFWGWFLT